MSIEVLLFDLDGVLFESGRFKQYLKEQFNLGSDRTTEFFKGKFVECSEGKSDLKLELSPFLETWNVGMDVETFLETWFRVDGTIIQSSVDYLYHAKAKGIDVGIASTQEKYRKQYIKEHFAFFRECDHIFLSCDLGYTKSQDAFYREIGRRLDNREILLIDDSSKNVEIARSNGWQALLFDNGSFDWEKINLSLKA